MRLDPVGGLDAVDCADCFGAPGLDGVIPWEGTHGARDGLDGAWCLDELMARIDMHLDQSKRGLLHQQFALVVLRRVEDGVDDGLGWHPIGVKRRCASTPASGERAQDGLCNHGVVWEGVERADARFRTTCLVGSDVILQSVDAYHRAQQLDGASAQLMPDAHAQLRDEAGGAVVLQEGVKERHRHMVGCARSVSLGLCSGPVEESSRRHKPSAFQMDAHRTTPPPVPIALPTAPMRKAKRAYRTKRKRAAEDADDLDWLLGGGPKPRDGGVAKLTCSPPSSDSEPTRIAEPTQPIKPTPQVPEIDPLAKYTPLSVKRLDSSDDTWMDHVVPATGPHGTA